jgi:membrane-associated protease RseP (regulator of RpoE activity)
MSQQRFSIWHVLGLVTVLGVFTAAALAGGVFLGFQWGRASAPAPERAVGERPEAPSITLPDLGPFERLLPGRAYLGLTYQPVTPALAQAEDLPVAEGAAVRAVTPGSPAEAAGVQVGDVITQVNGEPVDAEHDLAARVQALAPGDQVTLSVRRGDQTVELTATLGKRMAMERLPGAVPLEPGQGWRMECLPPEPCRLVPAPGNPRPEPPSGAKSLPGMKKQPAA